jgi:hypothetical protein
LRFGGANRKIAAGFVFWALLKTDPDFPVNLFDAIEKHPRPWILAEALVALAVIALLDIITTWQFSMFVFYCIPVFVVALRFPRRVGIGFVIFAALVAMAANYDTVQYLGLGGFAWSAVNRLIGFLFAAACGISIREVHKETARRLESMGRARELERVMICTTAYARPWLHWIARRSVSKSIWKRNVRLGPIWQRKLKRDFPMRLLRRATWPVESIQHLLRQMA